MIFSLDLVFPFLLVMVRCLTFYGVGPLFAQKKIPPQVQALASLATAFALFPTVDLSAYTPEPGLFGFALLIAREVLLGGLIGLIAGLVFAALRFAGYLVGVQMGFSLAGIFDPGSGEEVPIVGKFLEMLGLLVFLALDGHHILLRALGLSLERVGPGQLPVGTDLIAVTTAIGSGVFLLALQVGAPVLAALFLTDTALGFVARAVPQMNVFLIGIPAKIAAGVAFLIVTTPLISTFVRFHTERMEGQLLQLLRGM